MDFDRGPEYCEVMVTRKERLHVAKVAMIAALDGGRILNKYFRKLKQVSEKQGAGLVSEADRESELCIRKRVWESFPNHQFLGEEWGHTNQDNDSDFLWVVDPLDGTTNYVHGFPFFCISIGVEYKGEPQVGIVHAPLLGMTYKAILGEGAYLNGKRIRVSKTKNLESSLLATGFSYRKRALLKDEVRDFRVIAERTRGVRRAGSAALDFCMVASGIFDGFWERALSPWDVSAGTLIVREAGGVVTDFGGKRFRSNMKTVLAANKPVHRALVKFLK